MAALCYSDGALRPCLDLPTPTNYWPLFTNTTYIVYFLQHATSVSYIHTYQLVTTCLLTLHFLCTFYNDIACNIATSVLYFHTWQLLHPSQCKTFITLSPFTFNIKLFGISWHCLSRSNFVIYSGQLGSCSRLVVVDLCGKLPFLPCSPLMGMPNLHVRVFDHFLWNASSFAIDGHVQ